MSWYPLRLLVLVVGPWVVLWLAVMGTQPVDVVPGLIALGIVVVPVSVVALSSSTAGAAAWALGRGARFSAGWNDLLWHHLARTRVARTTGVTVGLAVPMMMSGVSTSRGATAWSDVTRELSGYWLAALGYVVGSLWAEARKPRGEVDRSSGAALLSPRRLGDHLDPNVSWALGLFSLFAVFVVTVWVVAPLTAVSGPVTLDQVGVVPPLLIVAVALGGAAWVSRRAERATDDAALAYEELTRTATVNALAGASIAMLGEFSGKLAAVPRGGSQISGWFLLVPMLVGLLGLGIWASCGTKLVFRNRRIDALRAAA